MLRARVVAALLLFWARLSISTQVVRKPSSTRHLRKMHSFERQEDGTTCAPMVNHGSHFTVEIEVGSPPQKLEVLADTGSTTLVVNSCACRDLSRCPESDKCFKGTGVSSSFKVKQHAHEVDKPVSAILSFGSGQIQTVVSSDIVRVAGVEAFMDESLMLMVDRHIQMQSGFEGLLGLGLPSPDLNSTKFMNAKSYLEMAHVSRFSMCFNYGSAGVFRVNTPETSSEFASIGKFHWGLHFEGISIGSEDAAPAFCARGTALKKGQASVCGAIPDSGTTMILGPPRQVQKLFDDICDRWPRCQQKAAMQYTSKSDVLKDILLRCEAWMEEEGGLDELPELHFHIRDAHGKRGTLSLPAFAYIVETRQDDQSSLEAQMFSGFPGYKKKPKKVCMPAFGPIDYSTAQNGDIWLLGTPFFYQYRVGYNFASSPPSMSFLRQPCGDCDSSASLYATGRRVSSRRNVKRPLLHVDSVRGPSFDTSLPL